MSTQAVEVAPLIERLRQAVQLGDVEAITHRIKADLEAFIPAEGLTFPERFRNVRPDSYARRLLHRDPELGFTAVVMTWGPGQRTALHDHSGIWCVEGVVEGEMEVTRYELEEGEDTAGLCRFAVQDSIQAHAGSAGALIPPFEYHVLANPRPDRISLTLHVYGGEMDHCSIFQPEADGRYRRCTRHLSYDE
ncbi:MAG TPA: cysteine dioxygenase [Thermoanaerobaculia bacterium]|jgi:predicted metal-dependent enzyme (double-stranded beta helix superfamily)|nr:cysteine dioxygenase [Thermoanaerobaculia bacterium]